MFTNVSAILQMDTVEMFNHVYSVSSFLQIDTVWVTYVPDDVVIQRLIERNGLSEDAAKARLAAQMPLSDRLSRAAVAVDTSGPKEATKEKLKAEWDRLVSALRQQDAGAAAAC